MFTIENIALEEYSFQSPNTKEFVELVNYFIDGLKMRSKYVVAMQDIDKNGLSFELFYKLILVLY